MSHQSDVQPANIEAESELQIRNMKFIRVGGNRTLREPCPVHDEPRMATTRERR
jgi:hypothetical protein